MLRLTIATARQGLAASLVWIALGGVALAQDTAPILPQANPSPVLDRSASRPGISVTPAPNATAVPPLAAAPVPPAQLLTQAQLDQLVAPIALYSDPLLAQILMASTYPLEVVEAARWVSSPGNRGLTGEVMTNALQAQNWDPSVKALVPFPRVLENMSNQLQWTEELGNAFLAQQPDVMAAVQSMRQAAMIAGNLKETPQCRCLVHVSGTTISILPAERQVVCVPVYSPAVYGRWPYPAYPPYSFPLPVGFAYPPGLWIGFGPPIALAVFGPVWGWGWVDWGHHYIAVDPGRYALASGGRPAFSGSVWEHNPAHRGGVAYADPATSARFNAARVSALTTAARSRAGNAAPATRFGGTGHAGAVDLQPHVADPSVSVQRPPTEVLRGFAAKRGLTGLRSTPEQCPAPDGQGSTTGRVSAAVPPRMVEPPSTAARSPSAAAQHRMSPAHITAAHHILPGAGRTVAVAHISRWVARTEAEHLTAPARMAADLAASMAAGVATMAEVTARTANPPPHACH